MSAEKKKEYLERDRGSIDQELNRTVMSRGGKGIEMKKHLWSFRKGWEKENLARFLLSRFSFVAHPSSVSDDVGTDFYCTIFDIISDGHSKYLEPRNSFAIQIKSNYQPIQATSKIEYLRNLELPYFVGFVNDEYKSLTVHTGEFLPVILHYKKVNTLKLKLVQGNKTIVNESGLYKKKGEDVTIMFPELVKFTADDTEKELAEKAKKLITSNSRPPVEAL